MQSVEQLFIYFACAIVINNVFASECHVSAIKEHPRIKRMEGDPERHPVIAEQSHTPHTHGISNL